MSKFLGRQITRMEFIYPLLSMGMNFANMVSLLILSLKLPQYFFLVLIPSGFSVMFAIAYIFDRGNVFTNKHVSHMDINYRKLNTENIKLQEFEMIKFMALMEAFGTSQQQTTFKFALDRLYKEYKEKWGVTA